MQLPLNDIDIVDVDRESSVRVIIPVSQRQPPCRLPSDPSSNRELEPVCSGSSQSVVLDSPGRSHTGSLAGKLPEMEPVRVNPGRSHTGSLVGKFPEMEPVHVAIEGTSTSSSSSSSISISSSSSNRMRL